jgi:hypothetical protein
VIDKGADHLMAVLTWAALLPVVVWRMREIGLPPVVIVFATWIIGTSGRLLYLQSTVTYRDGPQFVGLDQAVETGMRVLLVCSMLFVLGYVGRTLLEGRPRGFVSGLPRGASRTREVGIGGTDHRALARLTVGAYPLALAAIIGFLWLRFSGIPNLEELFVVSSGLRSFEIMENVTGNASALLALRVPAELVVFVWLWWVIKHKYASIWWRVVGGAAVLLGTLMSAFCGVLVGSRLDVVKPLLLCVWGWALVAKVRLRRALLAGVAAIALVAPIIYLQGELREDWARGETSRGAALPSFGEAISDLLVKLGATGHFVAVERTGYIAEYVFSGLNEFPPGGSLVLGIVGLVPRFVYPDKPTIHEGNFVAEEIAGIYTGGGMPAGLVGGLLLNFGVLGLLGLVAYGWALAYLDSQAARAARDLRAFMVVMTFAVPIAFDLLQSGIATTITEVVVKGAVLLIVLRLVTTRGAMLPRVEGGWGAVDVGTPNVRRIGGAS